MADIWLSLFEISVSVGLLVIVLIALTPFLNQRYAAKWKCLIWIFLSVRLLVPFRVGNVQFIMDALSQTKPQTVHESEETYADAAADAAVPARRIVVEIPAQMTDPIAAQSGQDNPDISILDIAVFIWMIGSLAFLLVHLISYSCYKRQVIRNGKRIEDAHILSQMLELKRELKIRRTIRAIEYDEAESPMILGFLKPVLLLPAEQYSSEELFFILKHEMVHLKRGDVYVKLLFVTANAVHWFNPLIWLMQKEAVVDIELSCDERVTQGASYAVRKAYTETLLSMLHKRCVSRTALSTQFYGGKKIMKKRFKNILMKNRKKNGICILLCVVIATIGCGTLVGCSVAKKDTETGKLQTEGTGNASDPFGKEEDLTEPISVLHDSGESPVLDDTTMLTFFKEGEEEQKEAVLAAGDGYSIYLPRNEWEPSGPDLWRTAANEQVRLWITHFIGESMESADQALEEMGYVTEENAHKRKEEGDLIFYAGLKEFEDDVWGIFYCYPTDAQEGWGRELPVIAETFAVSAKTDGVNSVPFDPSAEYLADQDCQEIQDMVDQFAKAYFDGNADAIRKFLVNTYEGEIDTYQSTGKISDFTVKGLSDTDEKKIEHGTYTASLEFKDSNQEDMFHYLTFLLSRQGDSWKIQSYGLEG